MADAKDKCTMTERRSKGKGVIPGIYGKRNDDITKSKDAYGEDVLLHFDRWFRLKSWSMSVSKRLQGTAISPLMQNLLTMCSKIY